MKMSESAIQNTRDQIDEYIKKKWKEDMGSHGIVEFISNDIGMRLVGSEKLGFFIGEYPVLQREWTATMGGNPSSTKRKNLPVTNVSWFDSQDFIDRLNQLEGRNAYRLPSEREWGIGDEFLSLIRHPNIQCDIDMHEWCQDWYGATEGLRMTRGGAWQLNTVWTEDDRNAFPPDQSHPKIGFRVIRDWD